MGFDNVTVIGLQWGDEGKGKIVDALARLCQYVVRYCGGANAGHTVIVGDEKFAFHLMPSGILSEGVTSVVGNGVAFDPGVALEEIEHLKSRGITIGAGRLLISSIAHMVMPWHKLEDVLSEQVLAPGKKIGTTARGIGPCYSDKATRSTAIRVGELLDAETLRDKVRTVANIKNRIFSAIYEAEPMDGEAIADEYVEYGRSLTPFIANTGAILRKALRVGERILFEGAQGSMLDIDHGTFPFVTSSPVTACGVPSGAAVPPKAVGTVIGIIKAYTSRVGAGCFPTEQENEIGEYLRERGREYGTTTGRPRRCGWFDAFAVRYAADISGVDELALSLLDVLSGLEEIKICTHYRLGAEVLEAFDPAAMPSAECIYQTLAGWTEDISDCRRFEDLPSHARTYVRTLEDLLGRPITFISVGAERSQTIIRQTQIEGLK